jgi:histidinol-phosphate aminotransferase
MRIDVVAEACRAGRSEARHPAPGHRHARIGVVTWAGGYDLSYHGDADHRPGLVDLAVNVRPGGMPDWLVGPIVGSLGDLGRYPDDGPARAAVAVRHRRAEAEVLLTAGAAQAFVLVARALRARHSVVVHPQFTEPEAALRAAGHAVDRVVLDERDGFQLDPARVPDTADLVVIGNPTNPTSVAHPVAAIETLARPGRVLVVDEAFADTVYLPGRGIEPESVASRTDLPGLVVIRSLTKTWGLAGLRIGYLLAPADLVRVLGTAQPLWPVSTPALAAAVACSSEAARRQAYEIAVGLAADRDHLVRRLARLPGVSVAGVPASSFVLVRVDGVGPPHGRPVWRTLREHGYAVRRGDTFPGLGPDWIRVAVRDPATSDGFVDTLATVLTEAIRR